MLNHCQRSSNLVAGTCECGMHNFPHTHTHTHTSPHPLELMYCPKYSIGHLSTLLSTWLSCCLPVIVHVCAISTQDELESSLQIGNLQTMEVALLYAMVLPWDFNGVCASWIETMKLHMTWPRNGCKQIDLFCWPSYGSIGYPTITRNKHRPSLHSRTVGEGCRVPDPVVCIPKDNDNPGTIPCR
jgi:hypothetical protein